MEQIRVVGICFIVLAYIIGSIPSGYSIGRFWAKTKIEVQEVGSRVTGATNVARATGRIFYGFLTILIDMFVKGWLLIYASRLVFGESWIVSVIFAAVLLGHIFPILTKFETRGKGVATLLGGLLAIGPPEIFGLALIVWLIIFNQSKGTISLASLSSIYFLLLIEIALNPSWAFAGFAIFASSLVCWAHRENIARIWHHQEKKILVKIYWKNIARLISIFKEIWLALEENKPLDIHSLWTRIRENRPWEIKFS